LVSGFVSNSWSEASDLGEVGDAVAVAVGVRTDVGASIKFPFNLGFVILDVGEEEGKLLAANFLDVTFHT
jgi:hypothetical protein